MDLSKRLAADIRAGRVQGASNMRTLGRKLGMAATAAIARDLSVTVGDVTVASPLPLGAWLGCSGAAAMHSHLIDEPPAIYHVHVRADGPRGARGGDRRRHGPAPGP